MSTHESFMVLPPTRRGCPTLPMSFHRGAVAITEGERAAEQPLPLIQELIG